MAKNLKASWFPELTPDKQIIENNLKEIIAKNYKKSWFINIETPTIELNSILTAKGWEEVAKQIFWLYGLAQWAEDLKDYSMHFDLTVPFARYVIEYENDLKFPFKRYQIQKVFRWERPQKCRYREFYQCDIDVVDENLDINYDIEVIETLYDTVQEILDFLEINKETKIEVHINNKHIINWICDKYNIDKKEDFFKLIDNYYKLPSEKFNTLLNNLVWEKTNEILDLLWKSLDINNFQWLSEEILPWVKDLIQIYNNLKENWVNVIFDPYITRWLDYYTWVVFETFIINKKTKPLSICSWGRYDNLVWAIRDLSWNKWKNLAWVWGSIGLSRLFCILEDSWLINKKLALSNAIIFNIWWTNKYVQKIKKELKNQWLNTDVYYKKAKLDKQFKYADSKNITFWIFAWESEEKENKVTIKNLIKRSEETINIDEIDIYFNK